MKFKKLIFFSVIIILLVFLGVFLWKMYEKPDVGYIQFEDFLVQETIDGKVITQEETGLRLVIPSDWEIVSGRDGLFFNTSDLKEKEGTDYDILYTLTKNNIKICKESLDYDCGYDLTEIDGNQALKDSSTIENESIFGDQVRVQVPKNQNLYIFESYLFGQDREECSKKFNKILKTIQINQ